MTYIMRLIMTARAIDALLQDSINVQKKILEIPKQSFLSKIFGRVKLPDYNKLQGVCHIIIRDLDKLKVEITVIDMLGIEEEKIIAQLFDKYMDPLRSSVQCLLELSYIIQDSRENKKPIPEEPFYHYANMYEKYDEERCRYGDVMNESFRWLIEQEKLMTT